MSAGLFDRALADVAALVAANAELSEFAPFDPAPRPCAIAPVPVPATRTVAGLAGGGCDRSPETMAAVASICALAPLVAWQHGYTEEQVGRDFLDRFGWFELIGRQGHFRSTQTNAFIAFWDRGLHYPWHRHEAEELYFVLAGGALFEAEGVAARRLGPGDGMYHASWQPHALTTTDQPLLALIFWRGSGLDGELLLGR